ncbi:arsenic resistance protein [Gluconobacter kanchanaburiensis]|nr:arsenic resistance protein [Gluconobacter kanchanaburiensis]
MESLQAALEKHQIALYFIGLLLAVSIAVLTPGVRIPPALIDPLLAVMLFATFLQVPLNELTLTLRETRFLVALLVTNFVAIPLLVALLLPFVPAEKTIRTGVLMVLLCPCIDWVVTFARMGGANAALLLASTPCLLAMQILMLPLGLHLFLGSEASRLFQAGPFLHAFIWLIVIPLGLAWSVQEGSKRVATIRHVTPVLSLLPVATTALVLFVVTLTILPRLDQDMANILRVLPVYGAFATLAPCLGWGLSRLFRLDAPAGRALAFSAGSRNSLVVLPLALGVSGISSLLAAIIVAQTMVELGAELVFIQIIPGFGTKPRKPA